MIYLWMSRPRLGEEKGKWKVQVQAIVGKKHSRMLISFGRHTGKSIHWNECSEADMKTY